jgi:Holliday junction resolvasome RuvABC endonuclease subunit
MSSNAPLIWAFDAASNTGVAEGRAGETPRLYSVRLVKEGDEIDDSAARAMRFLAEKFAVQRPDLVVIEAPLDFKSDGASNARTLKLLAAVAIGLGGCARLHQVRVRRPMVASIRKDFIGHGRLPGDQAKRMVQATCRALGWDFPNHDAADAAAVWFWGCKLLARDLAPAVDPVSLAALAARRAGP